MGEATNLQHGGVINSASTARAGDFVFSVGQSYGTETSTILVPTDAVNISERLRAFSPDTLNLDIEATSPETSVRLSYSRDIISPPTGEGFYLKTGGSVALAHQAGNMSYDSEPTIDAIIGNVRNHARETIAGLEPRLEELGATNTSVIIQNLQNASDTAINLIAENPERLRHIQMPELPDNLSPEQTEMIEQAYNAINERLAQPDVQGTIDDIEDINSTGVLTASYDSLTLSAGTFVEAGNQMRDVDVAGLNFDQVDVFGRLDAGYYGTGYVIDYEEKDAYYACHGQTLGATIGIRGHFNEKVSVEAGITHDFGIDGHCPRSESDLSSVPLERDESTSAYTRIGIKMGEEGEPTQGTGKGPILMRF